MAKRKRYTSEQIILKHREAKMLLGQEKTVKEVSRSLEIHEQTYYRWRKEYGGMHTNQGQKLKTLEKENTRLKNLVAELSLDNVILKEVLPPMKRVEFSKKGSARRGDVKPLSRSRKNWMSQKDGLAG